jgi:hypothetical protein
VQWAQHFATFQGRWPLNLACAFFAKRKLLESQRAFLFYLYLLLERHEL